MNLEGPWWWVAIAFFGVMMVIALIYRRHPRSHWQQWAHTDRGARANGAIGLVFASLGGLLLIGGPLADALARRQKLQVALGAIVFLVFFVVFSVPLLIFGRRASAMILRLEQGGSWQWGYWGAIVAITLGTFLATRAAFAWLGYEIRP